VIFLPSTRRKGEFHPFKDDEYVFRLPIFKFGPV